MIQVKKKDRETSEALIRRFSRRVQQSGILLSARSGRFFTKPKTKRQLRESARYRAKVRKEVEKLKKMGKFDEEALKRIKKKISEE
jgi:ribosomal protein S21